MRFFKVFLAATILAVVLVPNAFAFAFNKLFPPALALFDRALENAELDETAYCNALWAVQRDNNKPPLDADRARRYLTACEPHAEKNPAIYINAACVHHELGDLDACRTALAAAKRHRLRKELAELAKDRRFKPLLGAGGRTRTDTPLKGRGF